MSFEMPKKQEWQRKQKNPKILLTCSEEKAKIEVLYSQKREFKKEKN